MFEFYSLWELARQIILAFLFVFALCMFFFWVPILGVGVVHFMLYDIETTLKALNVSSILLTSSVVSFLISAAFCIVFLLASMYEYWRDTRAGYMRSNYLADMVGDWSFADIFRDTSSTSAADGQVPGVPHYTPPERRGLDERHFSGPLYPEDD